MEECSRTNTQGLQKMLKIGQLTGILKNRWFRDKGKKILKLRLLDELRLSKNCTANVIEIIFSDKTQAIYYIPLIKDGDLTRTAEDSLEYNNRLFSLINTNSKIGKFEFKQEKKLSKIKKLHPMNFAASNKLVNIDNRYVHKSYKRLQRENPEPEMLGYLAKKGYKNAPKVYGTVKWGGYYLAIVMNRIKNKGTAGQLFYRTKRPGKYAKMLGKVTRAFHENMQELGKKDITKKDCSRWEGIPLKRLSRIKVKGKEKIRKELAGIKLCTGMKKIQTHTDYHLEQILWTGKKFIIIDFESEPMRKNRTELLPGLRDAATMLRSFNFIKYALMDKGEKGCDKWEKEASTNFLRGYLGRNPTRKQEKIIKAWMAEKAVYEAIYLKGMNKKAAAIALKGLKELGQATSYA